MRTRNLIFILLAMALASVVILSVSAADDVKYSNETENVTFEGVEFTIPQGFGESKDNEDFDNQIINQRP